MKAFRSAYSAVFRPVTLNPNLSSNFPLSLLKPHNILPSLSPLCSTNERFRSLNSTSFSSSSMADAGTPAPFNGTIETEFGTFRTQLEESGNLREKIRNVALQIESATRVMHANLLLVHQSRPISGKFLKFPTTTKT